MLQRASLFAVAACILAAAGCATVPLEEKPRVPEKAGAAAASAYGFYHKVVKGQTLWRISKLYGVDIDELIQFNNLRAEAPIEIGQLILIPRKSTRADTSAAVVPPAPVPAGFGVWQEDFIWPLKGKVVSAYGQAFDDARNPGINIEARANRDVIAARGGKVVFSKEDFGMYGRTLIVDHGDGLSTVYARISEVFVKPGDIVQRGMRIARIGPGNRACLHFQVRKRYAAQNPLYYLP